MMKLSCLTSIALMLLARLCAQPTYTNPIMPDGAGADPAVLFHDGVYYAYTTNSAGAVWTSTDLVNWKQGPKVLPEGFKGAWAPEVYYHPEDGKFYMYYTNRYKIGVAVADRPDAQFENLGYIVIPAIDAHIFRDDDGQLYLYYTVTPNFTMYAMPMFSPTEPGGPAVKCFEISQDWERHSHAINEGPWIFKQDGTYYLFYSGSNGQSIYYSVGYATAPTPLGPFTKNPDNPVIAHTDDIWGPGHGSFARDRAGQWHHLYHQKTGQEIGWKRMICLDPLEIDPATGAIHSIPTKGKEQPMPATDPNMVWTPEISPRGAYFYQEQSVTFTSHTPGAAIHYTLDGSEPSTSSPRYSEPFTLDQTATIKACAFKDGMTDSGVETQRFTRTNFEMPKTEITTIPSGSQPFRIWPSPALVAPAPRK